MDPLSDVLALLKLQSYGIGGFDLGSEFCIQFPAHAGIKVYAILWGRGWLSVDGVCEPVLLEAGDCFVLPPGEPFRLTSDLRLPIVDYVTFHDRAKHERMDSLDGSSACFIAGGHLGLTGNHAGIVLGVLPPIVHLQTESDKAKLRWSIERLMEELRDPQPGGALIAEHLAQMLLVQVLRLHLADGRSGGIGWLFALADTQMSEAIGALHEEPGYHWTLPELAARVGMSRSAFAQKFKATVGTSPMEYLTRWRMVVAADKLVHSNDAVSSIAQTLGYESEAAFSTAFRRVMGCSPRQYSRATDPGSLSDGHEENGRIVSESAPSARRLPALTRA